MPEDPYTIADLARLADVTPRTVRYYVAQGLLPSPESAGPLTRYGEGHLARLRLIRRMQRDHLPLAEIRSRLERMGDEEVQSMLDAIGSAAPDPSLEGGDTLAYVRSLMQSANVSPVFHDVPAPTDQLVLLGRFEAASSPAQASTPGPSREDPGSPPSASPAPPPAMLTRSMSVRETPPDRQPAAASPMDARSPVATHSTWERLTITPDIEIHVRRPLDRRANKRVDQLERIARELFEEEP